MLFKIRGIVLSGLFLSLSLISVCSMGSVLSLSKEGDFAEMGELVAGSSPIEVNEISFDGTSALHWASYHNNLDAVQVLLDAGANPNASSDLGVTALWLAAENGSAEIVQVLLNSGANPNLLLRSGESIVMTASKSGNEIAVEALLVAGAEPNYTATRGQTALMWAASEGHAEVVRVLLEHNANPQTKTDMYRRLIKTDKDTDGHPEYQRWVDEGGSTALMFGASSGDLNTVRFLLDGGSDVNAMSGLGLDALKLAIYGGHTHVLELLLQRGGDPDSAEAGYTSLHAAVLTGNLRAVEILLENGADPDALVTKATATRRESLDFHFHEAYVGATALWLAARFAEPAIMKLLIENGSDPEFIHQVSYPIGNREEHSILEEGGISILMAAVGMGNQRLRGGWANSDRNYGGQTLKPRIPESVYFECVQIAVNAGAKINQLDVSGRSALDVARSRGFSSIVAFLENRKNVY